MDGATSFGGASGRDRKRSSRWAFAAGRGSGGALSQCSVIKLMRLWKRTGSIVPRTGARKSFTLAAHKEFVHGLVAAQLGLTLDELWNRSAAEGIVIGRTSNGSTKENWTACQIWVHQGIEWVIPMGNAA